MKLTSSTMARSDSEDVYEVTEGTALMKLQNLEVDDTVLDKPNDTTIHSGHFMVSHVHDEPPDDGEETEKDDNSVGFDLETVSPGQSPLGAGGLTASGCRSASSVFIDRSLRKLFECMTLAHCSKLTSPKWRNFKGINVRVKDKIRLNNIIWREWHMQYIKGTRPKVCHFETPVSNKSDGTLDYWKMRLDSLTRDYKRLSEFFAHRFSTQPDDHELLTRLLETVSQSATSKMANSSLITVPMFSAGDSVTMDDDAISDYFDAIFNPKVTNPCSFNTQTSLEEFMDTLEPLPPPLAVDFRGFGRLSSSVGNATNSIGSTKLPITPMDSRPQFNSNTAIQPSQPSLPSVNSQPLSFGSAEELFALLQSQLTSESSLECLLSDMNSSGYSSGATIQSGFGISNGSLVSTEGTSQPLLLNNGVELPPTYPNDGTSQLCSMFFLPETANAHSVQTLPIFEPVDELAETDAMACDQIDDLQFQELLQNVSRMESAMPQRSLPQGSASLPRMKASHDLSEAGSRTSRSIGSLLSVGTNRGVSNMRTSNETSSKPSANRFRPPQTSGVRHLPHIQPRPPSNCTPVHRQELQQPKQGTSLILPKPAVPQQQQQICTNDWSIIMTTGSNHLAVPIADQFAFKQDAQPMTIPAQGSQSSEVKRRVRHKSDQSSASRGTSVRPYAVFQPINPIQTAMSSGRSSSKTNCTVSFSLDKNTTISPAPLIDPPTMNINDLANEIILAAAAIPDSSAQMTNSIGKRAFGENHSCPGIFETAFNSCDISDALSHNSSSARSRHTSNESTKSTGSHDSGVRNVKPRTETKKQSKELRRVSHITAEQKRRCNIKCGFDTLIGLIPDLKENPSSRISKATALHKAADLCKKMKQEIAQKRDEAELLRNEIKALEADISACQSQLPASGAPPFKQPVEPLNERFEEYFHERTLENWKFFIFDAVIARPLLKSFDEEVTRGSYDQLRKSVLTWTQTHCSLASLRPRVTIGMVELSKQTSILSNPSLVAEEVKDAIRRQRKSLR